MRRPEWLNKKISLKDCHKMKDMLNGLSLNTVCQEASCPNISECFLRGEATFMILGRVCTRNCSFCGVEKGEPADVDWEEPGRVAEAVKQLNLKHAVITSVTRDDLDDGGAEVFVKTISAIRKKTNEVTVEVLIPDFKGDGQSIKKVVEAEPEVINHNVEVVPRLYKELRPEADYQRSLKLLRLVKDLSNGKRIFTKSGLMVGLDETEDEVLGVFSNLRNTGCDFLSIGQYLAPSLSHYSVKEYITPEKFLYYKIQALRSGFLYVASAPYVRSSYCASEYLDKIEEKSSLSPRSSTPGVLTPLGWNLVERGPG